MATDELMKLCDWLEDQLKETKEKADMLLQAVLPETIKP